MTRIELLSRLESLSIQIDQLECTVLEKTEENRNVIIHSMEQAEDKMRVDIQKIEGTIIHKVNFKQWGLIPSPAD